MSRTLTMKVLRDTRAEVVVEVQWTMVTDDGVQRTVSMSDAVKLYGSQEIVADLEDFLRHELGGGYIAVPPDEQSGVRWVRDKRFVCEEDQ